MKYCCQKCPHHPSDLSVADGEDGVVEAVNVVVTFLLVVHSARVEAETLVSGVDSNRDRAVGGDSDLQGEGEFPNIEDDILLP